MAADVHAGAPHSSSRQKTINWRMGCTFDRIGGSHVRWRLKHNIRHHTYISIHAFDAHLHTVVTVRPQRWDCPIVWRPQTA